MGAPNLEIGIGQDFLGEVGAQIGEAGRPQIRVYVLDLSTARSDVKIDLAGRFLWVIDSSSPTAALSVQYNDPPGQAIPLQRGAAVSGLPFQNLWVTNLAQSSVTITLLTSMTLLSVNNAVSQVQATFTIPGTPQTATKVALTNGAATLLSAANANKRGTFVSADRANTVTMLLGDVNVNANGFGEFNAGDVTFIETSGAIYAFTAAAAQNARVWDLFI